MAGRLAVCGSRSVFRVFVIFRCGCNMSAVIETCYTTYFQPLFGSQTFVIFRARILKSKACLQGCGIKWCDVCVCACVRGQHLSEYLWHSVRHFSTAATSATTRKQNLEPTWRRATRNWNETMSGKPAANEDTTQEDGLGTRSKSGEAQHRYQFIVTSVRPQAGHDSGPTLRSIWQPCGCDYFCFLLSL